MCGIAGIIAPKDRSPGILLVCDAAPGLMLRKLDIYRFFSKPPRVILVRRGSPLHAPLTVIQERIHLPVIGMEQNSRVNTLRGAVSALGYLMHAFPLAMKIQRRGVTIDLVHAHFIFPQGLLGLILARLFNIPLVISVVGNDVNVMIKRSSVLRSICKFVLSQASITIAVSNPLRKTLEQFGVKNTVYLQNSVDTSSITPQVASLENSSILFVGTLTENKRPLLLLSAFEKVAATMNNATLIMCGDGPLRNVLEEEVRRKRLEGKVSILGDVAPSFVIDLLSKTAAFVLPSRSEGMSNALLEAMAAGKVILASTNESQRDMFREGREALLFEPDDDDLARKLLLVLADPHLGRRLSRAARKRCEREFSTAVLGPQLERLYLETKGSVAKTIPAQSRQPQDPDWKAHASLPHVHTANDDRSRYPARNLSTCST